ncbi:MAG: PAS domain S-box protein [Thiovulaceae bacterium]|nr:PAS domain S-box protein [Sulfurimonadaceae bacterium]
MLDNEICEKIEHAHQEWMSALDSFQDAIFIHDGEFHVLRCNKAYQKYAGLSFEEIIGRKYYEIFPKSDAPSYGCQEGVKNPGTEGHEEELQVGDAIFRLLAYSIVDNKGKYLYSMHILEDITKYKSLEKEVRESEEKFRSIATSAQDAILMIDNKGNISYWNRAAEKIFGYCEKEAVGLNLHRLLAPKRFLEAHKSALKHFMESGEGVAIGKTLELAAIKKDGTEFPIELSLSAVEKNGVWNGIGILRDITERKRTEKLLRQSEEKFRTIIESVSDWIWEVDEKGNYTYVSPQSKALLGYESHELLGKSPFAFMSPKEAQRVSSFFKNIVETSSKIVALENIMIHKNGHYVIFETSGVPFFDENGDLLGYRGIDRDITERKQAEHALHKSEERYRLLFASMLNGFAYCQMIYEDGRPVDFIYLDVNEAFEKQTGLHDVKGKHISDVVPGIKESDPELFERYGRVASGGGSEQFEIYVESLKTWFFISVYSPKREYFVAVFDVITERKEAEASLHRANRALKTLSAGNIALVKASNEDDLLYTVTSIIVDKGGYALATVVYTQDDVKKSMTLMAWSGKDENYFYNGPLSWDDIEEGQLPSARAIRNGVQQICRDIENEQGYQSWKDACKLHRYASNIAFPLLNKGKVFGALSIYSYQKNSFDKEEIHLLEELANDLAYGIINLRTRTEHEQHVLLLQQSLEQSIQAIAATLESRDPYTAGHQRRVAELATAIAKKMNLPDYQVHGIHFAALIHDLGKIHVPSEILVKPGKLNDLEYKLIQMHPQTGYDILKDIQFPWPIATIILQHHEKIDGSGYPQGLKGDEILLESKIVALSDVVEAMSSHRPYRPSVGIEAAIDEIRHGRGSIYEPSVVDACLELFEKEKFAFSSTF